MRLAVFSRATILTTVLWLFACPLPAEVIINEIMYNPDQLQGSDDDFEWVELYNTGPGAQYIGGWQLWDGNPQNDPFVIPSNFELAAGEYLVLCRNLGFIYFTYGITNATGNYDFGLSNDGETVFLLDGGGSTIDQVPFNDRYPWPFQPDGDGPSLERINPLAPSDDPHNWAPSVPVRDHGTPGMPNSLYSDGTPSPIVINELHYHPASRSENDEYVELYNNSGSSVNLGGWEFSNGISFTFPPGVTVGAFEYLVVCKNQTFVRTNFGIENAVGDFSLDSSLSNGGETLVLRDNTGRLVDFVPFSDEQYWPARGDGYGPSIECINPGLPNHDPANWAASEVTRQWVYVETSPATPTGDILYFYLASEGEALLDDVTLIPEGGGDSVVSNGDFEMGDAGWVKYGNHSASTRVSSDFHSGTACLKIVSTGDGGGGEWRNYVGIPVPGILDGQNWVLSFWAKSLDGEPRLVARTANSRSTEGVYIAADLAEGGFVSTPGFENTASSGNLPPFIYHVRHTLNIPDTQHPTEVAATIKAAVVGMAPDGTLSRERIASVAVEYSAGDGWLQVPMYDDGLHDDGVAGDGEFAVGLPVQPCFTVVRYRIVAEDDQGALGISPRGDDMESTHAFFSVAPECYDPAPSPVLPIYSLFVSEENLQRLEQLGSRDDYVKGTFVYEGHVYDNVGVRWYGSFSERIAANKKSWRIKFNEYDELNGRDALILLGGDYTDPSLRGTAGIREVLTQKVFSYAGCANSETQHVRLELNGSYYGLMLQMERPDTDYLVRNNRDEDGDLFQGQSFPGQPASNMSLLPSYDDYAFAYDRKTNRLEPFDGLISLIEDLENLETAPDSEVEQFFYANLDVGKYASYLATVALTQNWVSPSRDYYLFYGKNPPTSEDTYLWEIMPWGGEHDWERPSLSVLNGIIGDNDYSLPNILRTRFLNNPALRQTFADRLRHLLDTTFTEPHLFSVVTLLQSRIGSAADYDRDQWWPEADSFAFHAAALKTNVVARRAFLYQWLDSIEGPGQPANLSPPDGSEYLSWPITLVASEFSGIAGSFHAASQWQVREETGLYSSPVWDSGEDAANLTSITVGAPLGAIDGSFFWRVKYKDDLGRWSVWSDETSFTTFLDTTPPEVASATCLPEVDDEVVVAFSEPVDPVSAETASNYLINGVNVPISAVLSPDGLTVVLTVSSDIPLNWLTISNVSDTASSPNVIAPNTEIPIEKLSSPPTKINFQPDSELTPDGYLKDGGAPFEEGRGYGWTADITDLAYVRNVHGDPRLDTLIAFGGEGSAWEIALPSPARYRVTVCLGDPASESVYSLSVENDWVVAGQYLPAGESREITKDVDLTDGRLTLYGGDLYKGTRITYVHVLPVSLDGDADLIDDVWEIAYFGSVEACDPGADPDGDGDSNYDEFLARTHPLSFIFEVVRIASSPLDPDWLEITWPHSPLHDSYMLQWSGDLATWTPFAPDQEDILIDGQTGTVTWTDKGTAPGMGGLPPGQVAKRFYAVKAPATQGL